MKPNMGPLEKTPKGEMYPIQYTDISFDHWLELDEEFPEEPFLIDQVIKLVDKLIQDIPGVHTNDEIFSNN